jgi:cysteine desulfurase
VAIYLDHNATTPLGANVIDAMLPYMRENFGNPSSRHRQGRKASAAIEIARQQVAHLVSAHPSQVTFTSGGTEANNLALKGAASHTTPGNLFIGSTEHASVVQVAKKLGQHFGWKVIELPVNETGLLSESALARLQTASAGDLISLMLANNETGVIQPLTALYEKVKLNDVIIHTDAVQAAGKIEVNFSALGVQLMTLSAHKIQGPKGVGALIRDKSVSIVPLVDGGGHESGLRSGTENVAGIVGFGCAAELAKNNLQQSANKLQQLRTSLEQGLKEISGVEIVAANAERLVNTTCFTMNAVEGETMLMLLDKEGISIASGSACSSNSNAPSNVLTAMGVDNSRARSALRISLGAGNTQSDVDTFLEVFRGKIERLDIVANSQAIQAV